MSLQHKSILRAFEPTWPLTGLEYTHKQTRPYHQGTSLKADRDQTRLDMATGHEFIKPNVASIGTTLARLESHLEGVDANLPFIDCGFEYIESKVERIDSNLEFMESNLGRIRPGLAGWPRL